MNATVAFSQRRSRQPAPAVKRRRVIVHSAAARAERRVFVMVNGKAVKRPVTTAGPRGRGVLVESGLIGGEDLIVSPPAALKDGAESGSKAK